ncbi:MAG: PTS sugar transporter subunit IIC [Leptolinea sp.]|jgi:PTS system cellobiose-specific IIC component|nr:PTS sugar transporter subunit IIC [Leptolinea sp.]
MLANMFREDGFLMKKVMPTFSSLGKSRFMQTINNGLFFAMPMIFVGVVFQVVGALANIFFPGNADLLAKLGLLQNMSYGLLGLFVCIGIARANAQLSKIVIDGPVLFAVTVYFILMKPTFGATDGSISFNFNYLGAQGMTLGMIAGFFSGEICALFEKKGWTIKIKNMPPFMTAWFTNMLAGILLVLAAWLLVFVGNVDVMASLNKLIAPLLLVSDTVWSMMAWGILCAVSFAFGIHPAAIGGIFFPLFLSAAAENAQMAGTGAAATFANGFHFASIGYVFALVNIGGACATLGLNIIMLFSKNNGIKQLGTAAIIPSIFTVNEPLIFGLPIVFNPFLALGALIVNGIINPLLAYLMFVSGLITAGTNPALIIFLPSPVIALLNNMGFMGFLGSLVIIAIDCLLWLPFLRMHEKRISMTEAASAKAA